MDNNVIRIEYQEKEIILVATAHVSKQSAELVKKVILEEQPDSVCVELDEARYNNMVNPKKWENTDIIEVIKSKKVGLLIANLVLGSYQKRIAKQLDTTVGQEITQGIESAKQMGAMLVLADRSIQVTFLRIWRKLGFWEKGKLISSLFFTKDEDGISEENLEELLQKDMLEEAMAEMRKQFPVIGEILISERDQYLASKIKEAKGKKIVAILGAAHVPGVVDEINKEQDMEKISQVPPKSPIAKAIQWIIPSIIVGLILYGFVINIQTGFQQISSWILWNSVMAAIFTALTLAHPLSILTAFVVSPISSLNPLLACGWFAGLVEAKLRKPTVKDVNNISTDIFGFKSFYKNKFLRILLVVIMANIGSSIGSIIAGWDIIKNLM